MKKTVKIKYVSTGFLAWVIFCSLAVILSHVVCVMPGPPFEYITILLFCDIFFILGLLGFAIVGIISLPFIIYRLKKPKELSRRQVVMLFLIALIAIVMPYITAKGIYYIRTLAFYNLAKKSKPITNAIESYHKDHGKPPKSLDDLIPNYIDKVPGTGMIAYPDYHYIEMESRSSLKWWKLADIECGDSVELEPWKTGAWYPTDYGANLIVFFDTENLATDVKAENLLLNRVDGAFNQRAWKEFPNERINMVDDFLRNQQLVGKNKADVVELLGEPSGKGNRSNSTWELHVDCTSGGINFDVFFYWPSHEYPDEIYGGCVQRIEEWAYVHE